MGSIPITVSDVVRETTLNFTVDILSSGFSCVVFKILDKSKKEGRVMEKNPFENCYFDRLGSFLNISNRLYPRWNTDLIS